MSVLKVLRLQKGWTIKEICSRSGINEQKYMRAENHQATLSAEEAEILSELLDVEVVKLFEATRLKAREIQQVI